MAQPAPAAATQAPAEPERPIPNWVGYTALGLGTVGVAVGAITGLKASSDKNKYPLTDCQGDACPSYAQSAVDDYNNLRTISTIGLYAGVGCLAAGAVILWVLPDSKHEEKPVAFDLVTTRERQEVTMRVAF